MHSDSGAALRFGLISDTHGMFRPEIRTLFSGVAHIFHAGDIGKPAILREIEEIAPTTAILGNIDIPSWFPALQKTEVITLSGYTFLLLHNLDELDLDPATAGIDAVIYGHSHQSAVKERNGVLYINPGSAGPPRFQLTPGVSIVHTGSRLSVKHIVF